MNGHNEVLVKTEYDWHRPTAQNPKLIVIYNRTVREFTLNGQQALGRRTPENNPALCIDVPIVSRRHGVFSVQGDKVFYQDVGSSNGTTLNDVKLKEGAAAPLKDGSVLRIHAKNARASEQDIVMIVTCEDLRQAKWKRIPLGNDIESLEVGRGQDISLWGRTASRKHAVFFHAENGWAIIDNNSLNGVYLNGHKIVDPVLLQPMDVVRIAGHIFIFEGKSLFYQEDLSEGQPPEEKPESLRGMPEKRQGSGPVLSIQIQERNVWNRLRRKTLLRDINLQIESGSLVLILGGSGAGKTTFMNAVMGYEPAKGVILYGENDIYREYEKMKYEIGYVPQQDLLRMEDVVYDTLDNAAQMRLPGNVTPAQRQLRVLQTLDLFGLSREKDSLVGKLSGGQRKRLSIAVEYIGNPSLFFLDEPDSGLDAIMAKELMTNLRQIADQGKIVMVISHSPDRSFDLFDKVIVLAKSSSDDSGRLVYYGSPTDACRFFDTKTLEAIVGRVNRKDEGGEGLADYFIRKYSGK